MMANRITIGTVVLDRYVFFGVNQGLHNNQPVECAGFKVRVAADCALLRAPERESILETVHHVRIRGAHGSYTFDAHITAVQYQQDGLVDVVLASLAGSPIHRFDHEGAPAVPPVDVAPHLQDAINGL